MKILLDDVNAKLRREDFQTSGWEKGISQNQ